MVRLFCLFNSNEIERILIYTLIIGVSILLFVLRTLENSPFIIIKHPPYLCYKTDVFRHSARLVKTYEMQKAMQSVL